jgi:MFS family permease
MLWPAQGVFTSENAGEEIGFYSGLFFTIYQLNMLIGSLIAASLLEIGLGQFWTFFTLVLIGVIGIILMLYLVPHAPTHENQTPKEHKLLKHILYETGRLLVQKKMLMIFPLFMYSGWTQSFFYGVVPPLIGVRWLGWAMAAFGFAEVLGSMAFAKISDGLGRKISMMLSLIIHALAVTSSFFLKEQQPYMFFVTTTLCGLADAGLNTSIYAVIGCEEFYKNEAAYAFSAFQLIQGIVTSTGFFTGIYLTYLEIQIVLVVLLGAAIVSYIILEVWIVKPKPAPEIN